MSSPDAGASSDAARPAARRAASGSNDAGSVTPDGGYEPRRSLIAAERGKIRLKKQPVAPDAGPADAAAPEGEDGGPDGGSDAGEADAGDAGDAARPAAEEQGGLLRPVSPVAAPLPEVAPDPRVAPVLDQTQAAAAPKPVAKTERPAALVKIILGILALMVLAYLGGHPRVQALEERLRISQVITIGFPFVILGLIARQPSVGILTDSVLAELGPLLRLGLGWIGFVVGFRFDVRLLGTLPPRATSLAGYATTLPFAAVVLGAGALLLAVGPAPDWRDPVFVRDALVLGAAGCMTTWRVVRLLPAGPARDAFRQVIRLEELAGVLGLAVVAAYFRPSGSEVTWQLPGTAWFFLTMGLGVTVAAVIYGIVHRGSAGPELVVLTLGSVAFSAGTAGYLHLSSVVVAFITGLVLANFPGEHRERMRDALMRLERPVYLLSLIVIGALWDVSDWRGWALMVVFVGARLAGKWLGVRLGLVRSGFSVTEGERKLLVSAPMGTLAIAIVINAQLLYPGGSIAYIVTAILGGAVASEVLAQVLARKAALGTPELSAAESTAGVDGGEG